MLAARESTKETPSDPRRYDLRAVAETRQNTSDHHSGETQRGGGCVYGGGGWGLAVMGRGLLEGKGISYGKR